MGLDPQLLEILVCPNCHGIVEYVEADQKIYCRGECRYTYPVRDDIPIMLVDETEKPTS